jgi:hypothetical protein
MRSRTLLTILCGLTAVAALPASASAGSGQLAVFQDDAALVHSGSSTRHATLDELSALGVDVVKVQLSWANVAPRERSKPAGFDGTDPAQYSWGAYADLVSAAQARGLRVMLALSPPYPGWATKRKRDLEGVDRPSSREFGRFAQAAGARFGTVDIWTIGNEPNHKGYLYPQSSTGGTPIAPHLYRAQVRASVSGLRRSGHAGDTILFGELLPIAVSARGPKRNLKPILFLREFFCLDSKWRPYRGRAARARGCTKYRKLTGTTGFAYHPYTRPAGPRLVEPSSDDATIRSLGRVTRALDIARRKGRLGGPRAPVWITEFGFQSNPPDHIFGARLSRIPGFMGESELWLALSNKRVKSYSQYTMTDTPLVGNDTSTWQSGLRYADGRAKRGVYSAYRLPIFVRLLGSGRVEVRGAARPGGRGSVVQVQQRLSGGFKDLGAPITVSNSRGYFTARFKVSSAARRTFRFRHQNLSSPAVKALIRP